jgi:RNA polymerase sigma-70 factor (ECF subfamily)
VESSSSLEGLVERACRRQDRQAVSALVAALGPRLAALVRRLGLPGQRADQLQGVTAHLLSVLPRFEPGGPARFTTWMTTVATRWLLMEARAKRPDFVDVDELELKAPQLDPSRLAEAKELSALVDEALAQLPAPQRRAFVLASIEGLPLPEVAACEGVPVGTIKSRLARARLALVLALGPRLDRLDAGGAR